MRALGSVEILSIIVESDDFRIVRVRARAQSSAGNISFIHTTISFLLYSALAGACIASIGQMGGNGNSDFRESEL